MRRLYVGVAAALAAMFMFTAVALAHAPTGDQLRRMIWGQTSAGWAPDHDVNAVQRSLEANCNWNIVDRWTLLWSTVVRADYTTIQVRYKRGNGSLKTVTFVGWHGGDGVHHDAAQAFDCSIDIAR